MEIKKIITDLLEQLDETRLKNVFSVTVYALSYWCTRSKQHTNAQQRRY